VSDQSKGRVHKGGASTKPKRSYAERNGAFMTPEEVADELACTERMVRRLIGYGELRSTKVGKLVRVHRNDLDAYISQQRKVG
jgi:excisionase family DNA binding protein